MCALVPFPFRAHFESHMRAAQPRVYRFGATGSLSESAGSGRPASTAGVGRGGFNHRLTGGGEAARLIDCRRRVCIRGLGERVVVVGGGGVGGVLLRPPMCSIDLAENVVCCLASPSLLIHPSSPPLASFLSLSSVTPLLRPPTTLFSFLSFR